MDVVAYFVAGVIWGAAVNEWWRRALEAKRASERTD
jgi:hypothetical protein